MSTRSIKAALLTAIISALAVSSNVYAGKGSSSGSQSNTGKGQNTEAGNTYRYEKHLGEKPKYQYKYQHQNQLDKQSGEYRFSFQANNDQK